MTSTQRVSAAVVVLAMLVLGVGLASLVRLRVGLERARDHCMALPAGITRLDAERDLEAHEAASPFGVGWDASGSATHPSRVQLGRRGALTSWQCNLLLDPSSTYVIGTEFVWWIPPDFHGEWDDDGREWLEARLL